VVWRVLPQHDTSRDVARSVTLLMSSMQKKVMSLEALVANQQCHNGGFRSGCARRVIMARGFQMPQAVRSRAHFEVYMAVMGNSQTYDSSGAVILANSSIQKKSRFKFHRVD